MAINTIGLNGIEVKGYKVTGGNGGHFWASDNNLSISFLAEGRGGSLYVSVDSYLDKNTGRQYRASRFTTKVFPIARMVAEVLVEENYIWDYVQQIPYLQAKNEAIADYLKKCSELGLTI